MRIKVLSIAACAFIVVGCGSTGVVKLEENHYMVSVNKAKVGFVSAAEEKASVYRQANEYCSKDGKEVKTITVETRDSGFARPASAALEFSCVEKSSGSAQDPSKTMEPTR